LSAKQKRELKKQQRKQQTNTDDKEEVEKPDMLEGRKNKV